ncbi:MAG: DUF4760 domain-containing protein [Candidatus Thorarchaeota archaeon]|jgi:hypothetical protein
MQDMTFLLNIAETAGILVGILIALFQLRRIQARGQTELETRQASLFMQIYDHFYNLDFVKRQLEIWKWNWSDYDDFLRKYDFDTNPETGSLFFSVGTYFEGIGVLVNRNLIDPRIVDDLMSGLIMRTWNKFGPVIRETRRRLNWPQYFEFFEYLNDRIKLIAENQHPELREELTVS